MLKFGDNNIDISPQNQARCPTCNRQFPNGKSCTMDQVGNKDCQVYYNLKKLTPLNVAIKAAAQHGSVTNNYAKTYNIISN